LFDFQLYTYFYIYKLCYATDAAFTYRMLQVIRDEDGQPHIVETDSSIPVNTAIAIVIPWQCSHKCEIANVMQIIQASE